MIRLIEGDCLKVLPTLETASVEAIVTDPPAGIGFMGKEWDSSRGGRDRWVEWLASVLVECRRVVKPGAFALVWALPRTSHWTALAVEEAGWTVRDRVTHLFGQGFPKSGSSLKPAAEDWWLAKAPGRLLPLQISACRLPAPDGVPLFTEGRKPAVNCYGDGRSNDGRTGAIDTTTGRWPPNVALDEEAARLVDEQSGERASGTKQPGAGRRRDGSPDWRFAEGETTYGDTGGASRFMYVAKASRSERGAGNTHPTVKAVALMRWLVRLVTPPGGTVLDPFLGSGTTALACLREGRACVGIERDPAYLAIARKRLADEEAKTPLFPPEGP